MPHADQNAKAQSYNLLIRTGWAEYCHVTSPEEFCADFSEPGLTGGLGASANPVFVEWMVC